MLGLWAVGLVTAAAAFSAYAVLGGVLALCGMPAHLALSAQAFVVFGLSAMLSPLIIALAPVLLSVRPEAGQCGPFSYCHLLQHGLGWHSQGMSVPKACPLALAATLTR